MPSAKYAATLGVRIVLRPPFLRSDGLLRVGGEDDVGDVSCMSYLSIQLVREPIDFPDIRFANCSDAAVDAFF